MAVSQPAAAATLRPPIQLEQLEVLRGLLAVYVLIGHARWLLWAGHSAWMSVPHEAWQVPLVYASAFFRFGREAVLVFFVLSGFFIHLAMAPRLAPLAADFQAGRFYRRRAHRLVAPYAFALLVTVACDTTGAGMFPRLYHGSTGDSLLDHSVGGHGFTPVSIATAAVMLPSSLGTNFGTNGPLWSLAYEVVYYACYPLWLWLRRKSGVIAFGALPLVLLLGQPLLPLGFISGVLHWYPAWLAGAGLAEFLVSARPRPGAVVLAVIFVAAFAGYLLTSISAVTVVCATLFAVAAVAAFATVPLPRSSVMRFWEFLGRRSFTIYIVHFPFLALLGAAVIERSGARPLHGWFAVFGAIAAVGFGCLCFELCERHFLHRRAAHGA